MSAQGEIITNIIQIHTETSSFGSSPLRVQARTHPVVVVMSQACDLEQDFSARFADGRPDKKVPSVLFCEVATATELKLTGGINSTIWGHVKINGHERYQFLEAVASECDAEGVGLEELGIDFKRFFTMPTDEVYCRIKAGEALRRCSLAPAYVQHLCQRFANYLSRIALLASCKSLITLYPSFLGMNPNQVSAGTCPPRSAYWTSDPCPISIGAIRVLVTGDRFWNCTALAEAVVRRLIARYGNDLVVVHGRAAGSIPRSISHAKN